MKWIIAIVCLVMVVSVPASGLIGLTQGSAADSSARERQLFDADWRFHAGEVAEGQTPSLDDGAWEKIDLPHDFMIEGKGQAIGTAEGPRAWLSCPPRQRDRSTRAARAAIRTATSTAASAGTGRRLRSRQARVRAGSSSSSRAST